MIPDACPIPPRWAVAHLRGGAHSIHVKPKTLLWTILVVGGLVYVLYVWAWPQIEGPARQQRDRPPKVVIEMPNPGG